MSVSESNNQEGKISVNRFFMGALSKTVSLSNAAVPAGTTTAQAKPQTYDDEIRESFKKGIIPTQFLKENGILGLDTQTGIEFNNKMRAVFNAIIPDKYKKIIGDDVQFMLSTDPAANAFAVRMEKPPTIILNAGLFTTEVEVNTDFKTALRNNIEGEYLAKLVGDRKKMPLVENIDELALFIAHETWHLIEQKQSGIDRDVFKTEEGTADFKAYEFINSCGLSVEKASLAIFKLSQVYKAGWMEELMDSHLRALNREKLSKTAVAGFLGARSTIYDEELNPKQNQALEHAEQHGKTGSEKLQIISENQKLSRKDKLKIRNIILEKDVFSEAKEFVEAAAELNYWRAKADNPKELQKLVLKEFKKFEELIPKEKTKIATCFIDQTIDAVAHLQGKITPTEFSNLVSELVKSSFKFHHDTTEKMINKLSKLTKKSPWLLNKEITQYYYSREKFIKAIKSIDLTVDLANKLAKDLAKTHDELIKAFGDQNFIKFQLFDLPVIDFIIPREDREPPWKCLYGNIKDPNLVKSLASVGLIQDLDIAAEIVNLLNKNYTNHSEYLKDLPIVGKGLTAKNNPTPSAIYKRYSKVTARFEDIDIIDLGGVVSKDTNKFIEFNISENSHILAKEYYITQAACAKAIDARRKVLMRDIVESMSKGEVLDPAKTTELNSYTSAQNKPVPGKPFIDANEHQLFLELNSAYLLSMFEKNGLPAAEAFSQQILEDLFKKASNPREPDIAAKAKKNIVGILLDEKNHRLARMLNLTRFPESKLFDIPTVKLLIQYPNVLTKKQNQALVSAIFLGSNALEPHQEKNLEKFLKANSVITKTNYKLADISKELDDEKATPAKIKYLTFKLIKSLGSELPVDNKLLIRCYEQVASSSHSIITSADKCEKQLLDELKSRLASGVLDLTDKIKVLKILTDQNIITAKESRTNFVDIYKEIKKLDPESRIHSLTDLFNSYSLIGRKDIEPMSKSLANAAKEIYINYTPSDVAAIKKHIDEILKIKNKTIAFKVLDDFASACQLKDAECQYIRSSIDKLKASQSHALLDHGLAFELIKEASLDDPDYKCAAALLEFLLKPNAEPEELIHQLFPPYNHTLSQDDTGSVMISQRQRMTKEKDPTRKAEIVLIYSINVLRTKEQELELQEKNYKNKIFGQFRDLHSTFVSSNAIAQSLILREIIIGHDEDKSRYHRIIGYSLKKLFPVNDYESKVVKSFLISYANNLHPTQRSIFSCILLNSIRNKSSNESGSAEFLLDVLSTDALKIKAGQKAAVTNGIPKKFQEVLIKLTESADKPYFWEFGEWIETVKSEVSVSQSIEAGDILPPSRCGELKEILGSASISVAGSLTKEGEDTGNVITIIRPDTPAKTKHESKVLKAVVDNIKEKVPELDSAANVFEKLVVSSGSRLDQELSSEKAKGLFSQAADMYEPVSIEVDGVVHTFKVPRVLAHGSVVAPDWKEYHYIVMEEIKGKSITNLVNSGEHTPEHLKSYCKAICAMEFFNIARGRFCSDRTNGNILINPETTEIGQIDFLGMLDRQWTSEEYAPVIDLIKTLMTSAKESGGSESVSKILIKLAEKPDDGQSSELVKEIEKSLISINVFAQYLTPQELLTTALSGIVAAPGGPLKEYFNKNYSKLEELIRDSTGKTLPPRMFVDGILFSGKVPSVTMINSATKMGLFQFKIND